MSLGKRIKEVRNDTKMSQTEFAKTLGSTFGALSKYEVDRVEPNEVFINGLCREYGVNKNWLLTGEGKKYMENKELGVFIEQLMSGQIEEIKNAAMDMRGLNETQLRAIIEILKSYKKSN